jgi:hypothetical protein
MVKARVRNRIAVSIVPKDPIPGLRTGCRLNPATVQVPAGRGIRLEPCVRRPVASPRTAIAAADLVFATVSNASNRPQMSVWRKRRRGNVIGRSRTVGSAPHARSERRHFVGAANSLPYHDTARDRRETVFQPKRDLHFAPRTRCVSRRVWLERHAGLQGSRERNRVT